MPLRHILDEHYREDRDNIIEIHANDQTVIRDATNPVQLIDHPSGLIVTRDADPEEHHTIHEPQGHYGAHITPGHDGLTMTYHRLSEGNIPIRATPQKPYAAAFEGQLCRCTIHGVYPTTLTFDHNEAHITLPYLQRSIDLFTQTKTTLN